MNTNNAENPENITISKDKTFNIESKTLTHQGTVSELPPKDKVRRMVALVLLGIVAFGTVGAVWLWDGKPDGDYFQLFEYMKAVGFSVLGGVVATYLNQNTE